jgi:hypothetical protein
MKLIKISSIYFEFFIWSGLAKKAKEDKKIY